MKLNPDCVRSILLAVEANSTYSTGLYLDTSKDDPLFNEYSWEEITYHIKQCVMSKLLTNAQIFTSDGYAIIDDLSPAGHEFLANIRNDNIWRKTLKTAKTIGSFSLSALVEIAGSIISNMINSASK